MISAPHHLVFNKLIAIKLFMYIHVYIQSIPVYFVLFPNFLVSVVRNRKS